MRNLKKSAVVLCAVFASMQIAMANDFAGTDIGIGNDYGGSQINNVTGGLKDINGIGTGNVDLIFNGDTHINWDHLNVGKGESLNFNADTGFNGLTVLNTVNQGMTNVYGAINANPGIAKLIISNPNGVLFDGAQFTTAGDTMITTQPMSAVFNGNLMNVSTTPTANSIGVVTIKDSNINAGGEFNILAPNIDIVRGTVKTGNGLKLVTQNGQDYLSAGNLNTGKQVRLEAVDVEGDVLVVADKGLINTVNGGEIRGNLNIQSDGNVSLNYVSENGQKLHVTGDTKVKGNGSTMFLRNAQIDGNLDMTNGGGFLDVGNVKVAKNANLTTTNESTNNFNGKPIKHFVHVIGDTEVGGNLTVESENNIHIGGYDYDSKTLADGKLTVGGDLTAHAKNGHVMTTIDTSANKISLASDNLNVLTDGKATLTANEYRFSANGYIGGLGPVNGHTVDEVVVDVMERYQNIPNQKFTQNSATLNIAGGNITALNTPTDANILSKGDVKLTGANAGNVNITAPGKYIEITGNNVKADNINVGRETDKLKVDYPSRNYNLNYTNIRDNQQVTIKGDEEVTYNLTDGENGYNKGTQIKGENTYLVGPDAPDEPGPGPDPTPDPDPTPVPDGNENVKVLRSFERQSVNMNQVYTPVAYAADLDDDQVNTGVRKNVDGSVTVVRAFPMVD